MVAAELDRRTDKVKLVSAGHPPPFLVGADGSVTRLDGGGPPIALGTDIEREALEVTVGVGDTLLFYTDGLVERRGETIEVGLGRLERALEAARDSGIDQPSQLCRWVTERLAAATADDVAMLAVRIVAPPRPSSAGRSA